MLEGKNKSIGDRFSNPIILPWNKFESTTLSIMAVVLAVCAVGLALVSATQYFLVHEDMWALTACALCCATSSLILFLFAKMPEKIGRKQVFAATTIMWFLLPILGMIPYLVTGTIDIPLDAWYESTSGFTATGSTVLSSEQLLGASKGVLLWRSITQWLGGIGVVALALLVIPFLGAQGIELFDSESPGHGAERLAPKTRDTVKFIFIVYFVLTVLCFGLYLFRGIPLFEAINLSLTTVSTGGFTIRPDSMRVWSYDPFIVYGTAFFMFISSCNLNLVWMLGQGKWKKMMKDGELRTYLVWIAVMLCLAIVSNVMVFGYDPTLVSTTVFTVISFITTGGLDVTDFSLWPPFVIFILLLVQFPGGMTGSTAGGMKIMRLIVAARFGITETQKQVRPHQISSVRVTRNSPRVSDTMLKALLGFMSLYIATWAISVSLVTLSGVSVETSIYAVTSSLSNIGHSLGEVAGGNFSALPDLAKVVCLIDMQIGRLEIFPVLIAIASFHSFFVERIPVLHELSPHS